MSKALLPGSMLSTLSCIYADSTVQTALEFQSRDRGMLQLPLAPSNRPTADVAPTSPGSEASSIIPSGITKHVIDQLSPNSSKLIGVSFLALSAGVHQLSGLTLQASDGSRVYDRLQPMDILVHA